MHRSRVKRYLLTTLALVLAVVWAFPVYWMLNSAFLPNVVLQSATPTFLPFGGSLDNLTAVATEPSFGSALTISLVVTLTTVVAAIMIAVLGALAISRFRFRGRGSFVLALLLIQMLPAEGHNWLAEPLSFFVVASVIIVWMSVPFVALSIYAGLTQVSTEVLEAAALDGAGGLQRLRHIILPLIAPVLSIVMLLQLIWDLRVFTQIKLLQDAGGVTNETNLLGTYVYQLGTGKGDFGTASAVSILILVLTIALSAYYVRSLMKEDV